MTVNIIADGIHSKHYLKKKTNEFFHCKNKDWVDCRYLFDSGILFRISKNGVAVNSLSEADGVYALICKYIEYLFSGSDISVYGEYNENKLSDVKGVRISTI